MKFINISLVAAAVVAAGMACASILTPVYQIGNNTNTVLPGKANALVFPFTILPANVQYKLTCQDVYFFDGTSYLNVVVKNNNYLSPVDMSFSGTIYKNVSNHNLKATASGQTLSVYPISKESTVAFENLENPNSPSAMKLAVNGCFAVPYVAPPAS